MDGYIKLSRKFFSNDMWNEARTFSSCEAWLDLIQSARFEATPRMESIGGREVSYTRGQYPASIRFLSKRWHWTERKVRTFLAYLKRENMITLSKEQGMNIITLVKYNDYNGNMSDTASDTAFDTVNDTAILHELNELRSKVTQLTTQIMTQQATQSQNEAEKRHTGDTKQIKDNNTTTPTDACAREENSGTSKCYSKFVESMKKCKGWLEVLAMNYKLSIPSLIDFLDDFERDCMCRGIDDTGKTLKDFKSHFNNWLLIRLKNIKKQENEHRQSNGAAATREQRQAEAVQLVAEILARDNK